jgi:hypothetical protein
MTSVNAEHKIFRLSFETGFKPWLAAIVMVIMFFILPIYAVDWLSTPQVDALLTGKVAGITTDNTGRYLQVPLLNFQFDTSLRDSGSISMTFGAILLVLAIIIILISFLDFRKHEHKYS